MVEYLLSRESIPGQAVLEQVIPTKSTPMHFAAQGGKSGVLELLRKSGADLCALNNDRDTPLHVAIRHGHEDFTRKLIKILVEDKTQIGKVDIENAKNNMTPYFIAVLQGMFDIAELLVKQGLADPKKKNSAGKTI